jgi:hypothetical protein
MFRIIIYYSYDMTAPCSEYVYIRYTVVPSLQKPIQYLGHGKGARGKRTSTTIRALEGGRGWGRGVWLLSP